MDSLPYVDTLFKEYLLFRGFTGTLQSFGAELAADRCCGFQAEALCELIFGQLLPQCRTGQLMELLELLADRLYSQLDGRFEALVERMEVAIIKAALVTCVRSGRQDKVAEFFRHHGDALLSGPEAGLWRQWAALAFVPTPRKDPAFQAYFNPEWMSLLEVSFRNFLSQVMAALPLPAVLRFNADRRHRLALQQQVDSLQRQLETLSQQLAAAQAAAAAAAAADALQRSGIESDKGHTEGVGLAATAAAPAVAAASGEPVVAQPWPAATAASPGGAAADPPNPDATRWGAVSAPLGSGGIGGAVCDGGGGSGPAAYPAAVGAAAQLRQGAHVHDGAGQPEALAQPTPSPSPPPLPPPLPPPRPPSPAAQQKQPPAQTHHGLHHHGRTLSLEAWHAVMDSEGCPEEGLMAAPGPLYGMSGGSGSAAGAFTGFASGPRAVATASDAGDGSGAGRRGEATAVAPPSPPLAAQMSPAHRAVARLPSLAEELGDPAPTPLGSASPRLASSVAAAAAAGVMAAAAARSASAAGRPQLREPLGSLTCEREAGGSCSDVGADVDADVEEDPAVMLVSGPTVMERRGGGTDMGGRPGVSSAGTSVSDGERTRSVGEDDDGTSTATADSEDDDDDAEVEEDREQEDGDAAAEGRGGDGARCGSGPPPAPGSFGGAAATAAASTSAAGSSAGSSASRARSFPVGRPVAPPGSAIVDGGGGGTTAASGAGDTAMVAGGRLQGVSTHSAAPGTLHGCGSAVLAAQFSPGSGQHVATGAADGSVAIWSPSGSSSSSSQREARLICGGPVTCVAWDARADKVMLVGTGGRGILAWHADTRRVACEIPPDPAAPWVSQLACSRKEPVFIVAAATAPPQGCRVAAAAARLAAAPPATSPTAGSHPVVQRVLSPPPPPHPGPHQHPHPHPHPHHHHHPYAHYSASPPGGGGGGVMSRSSSSGSGSSSGRLSFWKMRAYKRGNYYTVPQDSPVLSLAFNEQGSWFAAGTCCGDVHLFDSSSSGPRQQPLSSFRANATSTSPAAHPAYAPAAVQVYDSAAETVLVTCSGATVRLWSLRRLAEPLRSVPLLPYLPYGGGAGRGWSPDWSPCISVSPRCAVAAVVLGGGGPAVYLVDLQGNGAADEATTAVISGGGSSSWLGGILGSSSAAGLNAAGSAAVLNRQAAVLAGRVPAILPYVGGGLGNVVSGRGGGLSDVMGCVPYDGLCNDNGGGGSEDAWVYGTSCSWHPTRDLLVVGYSDGAVQTVDLSRRVGGGGGGSVDGGT